MPDSGVLRLVLLFRCVTVGVDLLNAARLNTMAVGFFFFFFYIEIWIPMVPVDSLVYCIGVMKTELNELPLPGMGWGL